MYIAYRLHADELDQQFLEALKLQFQGREIEIVVREATEQEEDDTAISSVLRPIASAS